MSGKTVTRGDLCEAVYQKVGLSRTELASLRRVWFSRRSPTALSVEKPWKCSFGSSCEKKGSASDAIPDGQGSSDFAAPCSSRRPFSSCVSTATASQTKLETHAIVSVKAFNSRMGARVGSQGAGRIFAPSVKWRTKNLTAQHVLRFWESRFHEIKPMRRGRRGAARSSPSYLLDGEGYKCTPAACSASCASRVLNSCR